MILEKAIWTALPNGLDDHKRLRLSVHVAPRLTNDDDPSHARSKRIPDVRGVAGGSCDMRCEVRVRQRGPPAESEPERPDPDLWKLLFPSGDLRRAARLQRPRQEQLPRLPVVRSAVP